MKTYNYLLFVPVLAMLKLTGCERSEIIESQIVPCSIDFSKLSFDGKVTNIEGAIITLATNQNANEFHIKIDSAFADKIGRRLPLAVCNLPAEYKVQGLKIIFSGNIYYFKHPENVSIDVTSHPIELTEVKRR